MKSCGDRKDHQVKKGRTMSMFDGLAGEMFDETGQSAFTQVPTANSPIIPPASPGFGQQILDILGGAAVGAAKIGAAAAGKRIAEEVSGNRERQERARFDTAQGSATSVPGGAFALTNANTLGKIALGAAVLTAGAALVMLARG